ncbi:MAG: rhomboid family intramembrane serine protease [Proteobacteria bacterium]|nr:rhomboid family intramembrane serine protease [Pseudomonadota bacterium]
MLIIPTEKRFDWKHAPIVLFILVVLNTVIFFGYQFGDDKKIHDALMTYKDQNFLEAEWPVYKKYLLANGETDRLEQDQELYKNRLNFSSNYYLMYNIVSDPDFYNHLDANSYNLFSLGYLEKWAVPRMGINNQIQSVSSVAYGLIPARMSFVTLFTAQFLHGSVMHLLGNMFFLIICGFAVEAAIGHLRFLLYYLATGIAGGLLFSWVDMSSTVPGIGASGAISGVMAMYLGVFRFKKIEFFYWFFVFVGYFRAPALLILPFYIGKEVYSFFSDSGANIGFMAHTGGFIAGGVLMALTYFIKPDVFNDEYIQEDQDLPNLQKDLAKVYGYISKSRLESAVNALDVVIKQYGITFDRLLLRFNLFKMLKSPKLNTVIDHLITMQRLQPHEQDKLVKIWQDNVDIQQQISIDDLYKFGWNLANKNHSSTAEKIFNQLNELSIKHPTLGMYARKLSVVFGKLQDNDKKQHYELLASQLLQGKN